MTTRRNFLVRLTASAAGLWVLPSMLPAAAPVTGPVSDPRPPRPWKERIVFISGSPHVLREVRLLLADQALTVTNEGVFHAGTRDRVEALRGFIEECRVGNSAFAPMHIMPGDSIELTYDLRLDGNAAGAITPAMVEALAAAFPDPAWHGAPPARRNRVPGMKSA